MADVDYTHLQQRYGGQYIARRAGEVLAHAATYEDLSDLVDALADSGVDLIIEYVEPVERVRVYLSLSRFMVYCALHESRYAE
jgi:hypothetical protein